jgi:hypothetical protein
MHWPAARLLIFLASLALLPVASSAQEFPQEKGAARTVQMFRLFCLSQLPDFDGIRQAAGFGEFAQIVGAELQSYQPDKPADELHAWRFHDHGMTFVLTATRSGPDATVSKQAPKFAKSKGVGCSLIFEAREPDDAVLAELAKVLGRAPDTVHDDRGMKTRSWTGQNAKLLSIVNYSVPLKPGAKGVLSATAFVLD